MPKKLERDGLNKKILYIIDSALEKIIITYTREAGVRSLERKLGEIGRRQQKNYFKKIKRL